MKREMASYHPTQGEFVFTFNDYWLTILCYVDYDSDWDAIRRAATNVTDGRTKQRLIERLAAIDSGIVRTMLREVYKEEVTEAREWFRHHNVVEASAW